MCVFDSNQNLFEVLAVQCTVMKTKKEPIREQLVVQEEPIGEQLVVGNEGEIDVDEPIETLHSALIALSTCFLLLIIFIASYCVYQHNKKDKKQKGYPNLSKNIRKVDEQKVKE